ncbi:MAG: hypothetical protein QUT30_04510, partial [Acidobacteriota bacterium]|nr:hypothetical protein [Acidobacteriota bacterium]
RRILRQMSEHVFWKATALTEGWNQRRHTVHLFNSELLAFNIHHVSDDVAWLQRNIDPAQSKKSWRRLVGHF